MRHLSALVAGLLRHIRDFMAAVAMNCDANSRTQVCNVWNFSKGIASRSVLGSSGGDCLLPRCFAIKSAMSSSVKGSDETADSAIRASGSTS